LSPCAEASCVLLDVGATGSQVEILVSENSEGDAGEPFEEFYRREQRRIVALAYVLCGSASVAEELAHDAFVKAMGSWPRVSQMDAPDAWVRRVVANASTSRFRRLFAESRALLRLRSRAGPSSGGVEPPGVSDVWDAVRQLPRRQAQVIALVYLHDLSRRETAEILGCSEETVKTHLERARRTLALQLGESYGEEA
jgi:RNA polymerase sigma factor (sigma-70 family)